ncbi:RNA-directed DNA polymerase, eukaryota, reverse transcriptase zinc-binding domain protein, partial [Tanacetum coccineum]
LYALELDKSSKVTDRWKLLNDVWGGNWSWRLPPRGRVIEGLSSLVSLIGNLAQPDVGMDKWAWKMNAFGFFKVKDLVTRIQNSSLVECVLGEHHIWNSWIPRKVNICTWKASLNRLATRTNLANRGVILSSRLCPFCERDEEEINHCFVRCPMVIPVWRKIWSRWNLPQPLIFPSFSISDIVLGKFRNLGCPSSNKIIKGVFHCTLWAIWKWRNKLVNATKDSASSIKDEDIFLFI